MLNAATVERYIKDRDGKGRWLLRDRGQGNFIAKWDVNLPKPTDSQLNEISATLAEEREIEQTRRDLEKTDKDMARIAEEVIDVLKTKGVLEDADLSLEARNKIAERKAMRSKL